MKYTPIQNNQNKKKVNRISISLPSQLLTKFDKAIEQAGFTDRSKAIQAALYSFVNELNWKGNEDDVNEKNGIGVGVIILLYDNHIYSQDKKSTHIQHQYNDVISAATHVHLDNDKCLESIMVKGKRKKIKDLATKLSENRGINSIKVHFMSL